MNFHLYQLGPNLLLNGDCTDAAQVRQLYDLYQSLGGERIELCLTDPPYGVKLGSTGSSLVACHRTGRKWLGIELEPRYCLATCLRFRYETANQVPVYEILPNGERLELSDAELKARFDAACQEQAKAKAATGGQHA